MQFAGRPPRILTVYSGLPKEKWAELKFLGYLIEDFPMFIPWRSIKMEIATMSRKFWKTFYLLLGWKIPFPVTVCSNSSVNSDLKSAHSKWKFDENVNVHRNPTSSVPMAMLRVNCPSWSLCNKRTTLVQGGHLAQWKLMGGILPLASLLGSHCSLEHHICTPSFRFPNTPDCSWKSAQSLAQKQTTTKPVVTNCVIECLYCYC